MKIGDIIGFTVLALMVLITVVLCDRQGQEVRAINDRLAALEDNMVDRTVPRITIEGRAAVYAGSGEIVVEKIEK